MADVIEQALEHAPANPGGDQPATPAPAATPAAQPAPVESNDPDEVELREAKAAAEAEEATAAKPTDKTETPAATPAAPAATPAAGTQEKPTDQQEQPQAASPMIPKARLDEVLGKNDELTRQLAFMAGQIEALKGSTAATPAATPTPTAPQPSAQDRLIAVGQKVDALAKKYDAGEISYAELKKQERDLANEEQTIREEILLAKVQPPKQTQAPQQANDLYLDQLTAKLEQEHPYVAELSDDDFDFVAKKAQGELEKDGVNLQGAAGKYALRERIAVLSDTLGPVLTGKQLPLPGKTPAPAAPAVATPAPGLSAEAQARAAKLALAATMPPNVSQMTGTTGEVISESAIENMSDDDLAALPTATRHRFLGITPS